MRSRHDDRLRTEYGSHSNCRTIQIVAWNYRRADVPALVAAPIAPLLPSSRDPEGGDPPTPIRADVEVAPAVAPAAEGLLAEEEAMTVTYCTTYNTRTLFLSYLPRVIYEKLREKISLVCS